MRPHAHPAALSEIASLIDASPDPRIVLDRDYRIVHANPAYRREFAQADPIGRRCYEVSHGFDRPCDAVGEACPLADAARSGAVARVLHLHHTPRGEEHVDVETLPVRDERGRIGYFVETLHRVRHAEARSTPAGLVGRSAAFKQMLELVLRAAPTEIPVLLLGETGTGKELIARTIHEASARAEGPFVAVDCAGMTETLFESELFGYEKGAFTGANHRKQGLVEAAARGTLFLDEIGDMSMALQMKLLRLLETGTFRRVGSVETLRADFRPVFATHRDLAAMVEAGTFRRDLYYRISAYPVHTPALAERREDIALLAESLLARVAPGRALRFTSAALDGLARRDYPGNIRELRNLIERAAVLASGDQIEPTHLQPPGAKRRAAAHADGEAEIVTLAQAERSYLRWAARTFRGTRRELAQRLGISERSLFRKLGEAATKPSAGSPPAAGAAATEVSAAARPAA